MKRANELTSELNENLLMTLPIEKRINTELFIHKMAVHHKVDGRIKR